MTIKLNRGRVALVVAALAVGIAGVSYAAVPAANGTISACRDSKGTLKVIDAEAGQTCNANQQPLTWSQQGPPGPAGASGVSGYEVVSLDGSVGMTTHRGGQVLCPTGKKALGGGGVALTDSALPWPLPNAYVDKPLVDGVGWDYRAYWAEPGLTWSVRVYAICAYVD